MLQDLSIMQLTGLHGAKGLGIYLALLMRIYGEEGFFAYYDKGLTLAMSKETGTPVEEVEQIIEACIEVDLFDSGMFLLYKILTSKGIQERWERMAKNAERTLFLVSDVDDRFALTEDSFSTGKPPFLDRKTPVSRPGNPSFSTGKPQFLDRETLSGKEKKSKTKEKKHTYKEKEKQVKEKEISSVKGNLERGQRPTSLTAEVRKEEKEKSCAKKEKEEKTLRGTHVRMTDTEVQKLEERYGKEAADWMIERLDNYKAANGKRYKDDYRAILSWVAAEYERRKREEQRYNYYQHDGSTNKNQHGSLQDIPEAGSGKYSSTL